MNGLGGGGFLVAYLAERKEAVVIEYPVIAPLSATPDMYTPAPKGTPASYHWDAMVDDANVIGHRSVSVPGTVAGLALALERYGTITPGRGDRAGHRRWRKRASRSDGKRRTGSRAIMSI